MSPGARPSSVLSRRELMRAGAVGGLVVVAPGFFAACSDDGGSSPPKADGGDGAIRLVASDVERAAADPGAIDAGVASVVALAGGLYGQLVGDTNLGISPFSA